MPQVVFEPTIPVFEQAENVYASDRAATAIGSHLRYISEIEVTKVLQHFCKVGTNNLLNATRTSYLQSVTFIKFMAFWG
jgi:hypothetical protein